ncbi:hypothetical protein GCM10020331_080070 [Ectobacillus funiculus]
MIVTDIIKQFEAEHKDVKVEVEVLENEQYKKTKSRFFLPLMNYRM